MTRAEAKQILDKVISWRHDNLRGLPDIEYIADAIEFQQAEKDLGWISVKDRLPEVGHYVFTCCDNQGTPQSVAVGFYDSDGSWFDDLDGRIDVDYWMEVPNFNKR